MDHASVLLQAGSPPQLSQHIQTRWAGGKDGHFTWHHQSAHSINPWAVRGLEVSPRTPTSHLAMLEADLQPHNLTELKCGDTPRTEHAGSISWKSTVSKHSYMHKAIM